MENLVRIDAIKIIVWISIISVFLIIGSYFYQLWQSSNGICLSFLSWIGWRSN